MQPCPPGGVSFQAGCNSGKLRTASSYLAKGGAVVAVAALGMEERASLSNHYFREPRGFVVLLGEHAARGSSQEDSGYYCIQLGILAYP